MIKHDNHKVVVDDRANECYKCCGMLTILGHDVKGIFLKLIRIKGVCH